MVRLKRNSLTEILRKWRKTIVTHECFQPGPPLLALTSRHISPTLLCARSQKTKMADAMDRVEGEEELPKIYDFPGLKGRAMAWKYFGFYKIKDGPPIKANLKMTHTVCRLCRKEYAYLSTYRTNTDAGLLCLCLTDILPIKLWLCAQTVVLYIS